MPGCPDGCDVFAVFQALFVWTRWGCLRFVRCSTVCTRSTRVMSRRSGRARRPRSRPTRRARRAERGVRRVDFENAEAGRGACACGSKPRPFCPSDPPRPFFAPPCRPALPPRLASRPWPEVQRAVTDPSIKRASTSGSDVASPRSKGSASPKPEPKEEAPAPRRARGGGGVMGGSRSRGGPNTRERPDHESSISAMRSRKGFIAHCEGNFDG